MSTYGIQKGESSLVIRLRLVVAHLACLGVFFLPITRTLVVAAVCAYFIRVFASEGVAHRYFSHRSYKTSRLVQFCLGAFVGASGLRGPIWWASHHRKHHRYSDGPLDVHSPVTHSRWYAFIGWLYGETTRDTDLDEARDLAKYPELVWVNKYHYLFLSSTLVATFAVGHYTAWLGHVGMGLSAVVWLFFLPTLLAIHSAGVVNTFTHGRGPGLFNQRRFETGDTTTNSWVLAIPTMGSCWHNNHHRYMNTARAGFYWWELDLTYLVLRALALMGLVWDLHPVPESVLVEGRRQARGQ